MNFQGIAQQSNQPISMAFLRHGTLYIDPSAPLMGSTIPRMTTRKPKIRLHTSEVQQFRLSVLLKHGAIFLCGFCVLSLYMWSVQGVPILAPYPALLFIIASPFAYWMGVVFDRRDCAGR